MSPKAATAFCLSSSSEWDCPWSSPPFWHLVLSTFGTLATIKCVQYERIYIYNWLMTYDVNILCLFNICIFLILRQTSKSTYYYSLVYDSLKVLHFIYLIVCVHAHEFVYACWGMCVSLSQHMCEGQRTISRSQFSPSTMWVLGFKLRPSGLAKGSFTYWAISPVLQVLRDQSLIESFRNHSARAKALSSVLWDKMMPFWPDCTVELGMNMQIDRA